MNRADSDPKRHCNSSLYENIIPHHHFHSHKHVFHHRLWLWTMNLLSFQSHPSSTYVWNGSNYLHYHSADHPQISVPCSSDSNDDGDSTYFYFFPWFWWSINPVLSGETVWMISRFDENRRTRFLVSNGNSSVLPNTCSFSPPSSSTSPFGIV